jgi:hypothetical protein
MNSVHLMLHQHAVVGSAARSAHSAMVFAAIIMAIGLVPAFGQSSDDRAPGIGKVHDLHRTTHAREQPSLEEEVADIYAQYLNAKDRFQKASNIEYTVDLSTMYQLEQPACRRPGRSDALRAIGKPEHIPEHSGRVGLCTIPL